MNDKIICTMVESGDALMPVYTMGDRVDVSFWFLPSARTALEKIYCAQCIHEEPRAWRLIQSPKPIESTDASGYFLAIDDIDWLTEMMRAYPEVKFEWSSQAQVELHAQRVRQVRASIAAHKELAVVGKIEDAMEKVASCASIDRVKRKRNDLLPIIAAIEAVLEEEKQLATAEAARAEKTGKRQRQQSPPVWARPATALRSDLEEVQEDD